MSTIDDREALEVVTATLVDTIASIEPDQWPFMTPCSDWDLAALIDHITGGNWFTVAVLAGATSDGAMTVARQNFAGGSATSEVAVESLHEQHRAFLRPGVLDQVWSHVAGDLTGLQVLRLRLHDLIVHLWDVIETVRPGVALPDDLALWGLDELATDDSLTANHFDLGMDPLRSPAIDVWRTYLDVFGR